MGLPNDLRAAVEHAPPPEFDLDQLIRQGRARKVRSSVFATVGAFAVVGLVLVAGYATAVGFRSAGPSQVGSQLPGAPAPAPASEQAAPATPTLPATPGPWTDMSPRGAVVGTPQEQATAARLTAALAQLPAELNVPTDGSARFFIRYNELVGTTYVVIWEVEGLYVNITVHAAELGADDECSPGEDPNGCAGDEDANGTMYVTGGEEYFGALYFRNDGTVVDITAQVNAETGGRLESDVRSSVRTAARNPGLSLFP
jgi:hypothetical protein